MKKTYVFYPLQIISRHFNLDVNKFRKATVRDKVIDNKVDIDWRDEKIPYSIITDSSYWDDGVDSHNVDGVIFGRFLKLRKDPISQIDIKNFQEEVVTNTPSKYLLESAYFILDTKNNIMLAQYNKNSLNVLSKRSGCIFKNVLMKINNNNNFDDITPIPSGELIKKILSKQSPVKSYHLKFRNININYLEKKIGISSEKMKELSASYDFDFNIDIKFSQQPHMGKFLYETIKSKIPPLGKNMKGYKVKTEDGSFDLIKDNLLYYDMPIEGFGTNLFMDSPQYFFII